MQVPNEHFSTIMAVPLVDNSSNVWKFVCVFTLGELVAYAMTVAPLAFRYYNPIELTPVKFLTWTLVYHISLSFFTNLFKHISLLTFLDRLQKIQESGGYLTSTSTDLVKGLYESIKKTKGDVDRAGHEMYHIIVLSAWAITDAFIVHTYFTQAYSTNVLLAILILHLPSETMYSKLMLISLPPSVNEYMFGTQTIHSMAEQVHHFSNE